ncbi:NYN domain-containing protein [soil metagenome]
MLQTRSVSHIVWFVDVMNVVGSRPDGWWRDRKGAMADLVATLDDFASSSGDEVIAVLDGRPFALEAAEVEVVFAPGGPNAADEEILRLIAADARDKVVVTSDRALAEQAKALGTRVVGAGEFRGRLDSS